MNNFADLYDVLNGKIGVFEGIVNPAATLINSLSQLGKWNATFSHRFF